MGSGRWDAGTYAAKRSASVAATGSTFAYTDHTLKNKARSEWKAHETLDPKGVLLREARDSDEHPLSTPITVLFDVTGSMRKIPRTLQEKLPGLLGALLRKDYVDDPQIMFGGIGDAKFDAVPFQVGQWESDNRLDDNLANLVLEGGGGGGGRESYEVAMYFMARHTETDALQKRNKKGYLFIIGDEMAYPTVSADEVNRVIDAGLQEDISTNDIVEELKEKFEVYFIIPENASHGQNQEHRDFWVNYFGQNVLRLRDASAVTETIALTVGIAEGRVDVAEGAKHLRELGSDDDTVDMVSSAVSGS